jgi:hypothetical protein
MLVNVSKSYCNVATLTQHFCEAYPNFEVVEINISYDVAKLTKLDTERERARKARIQCEK